MLASVEFDLLLAKDDENCRLVCVIESDPDRMMTSRGGEFGVVIYSSASPL